MYVFDAGKKRRLTILECSNDINMMIDVAKVADLVRGGPPSFVRSVRSLFFFCCPLGIAVGGWLPRF